MELLLCFKRILRLILLGVKPVFVFDGETPELKRKTVMERFKNRYKSDRNAKMMAQRIILNLIDKKPRRSSTQSQGSRTQQSQSAENSNSQFEEFRRFNPDQETAILKMLEEFEEARDADDFEEVAIESVTISKRYFKICS